MIKNRFKHDGDGVVVHSIPNLDTLETEEDLENFMKVIFDASDLSTFLLSRFFCRLTSEKQNQFLDYFKLLVIV
jgi:hypothetical protein